MRHNNDNWISSSHLCFTSIVIVLCGEGSAGIMTHDDILDILIQISITRSMREQSYFVLVDFSLVERGDPEFSSLFLVWISTRKLI